ncbi:hypothetical protein Vretimale_9149 [Volvox reticuliferus]|uniref:Uncharacterized protein n=1 Tax=Volvox reticuliferus TaxID=1737510 RepID=A0A8J4GC65_9CHLO|nr:hypothetical protein Vretifemale_9783 [Volvox reticuliferus]GIM04608.1 hypothetical protein Vretimale_9149 [Volvox reticuliferus]
MRSAPQAPPNRPVLDEKEKARLAELMRFRGKVPTVTPEQLADQLKAAPRKSEREQLEEMFEAIVKEIEERREFLQALEAAGRLRIDTVHMVGGVRKKGSVPLTYPTSSPLFDWDRNAHALRHLARPALLSLHNP